jgi:uncharacterized Rmd1/YagE family protein
MEEEIIHLNCYKFSKKPELLRVAGFFGMAVNDNPRQLILTPEQIESTLKIYSPRKYALLFNYGCICLVNFDTPETYRFIHYLESICEIDYNLFSLYNESHQLKQTGSNFPETIGLFAAILGKSTELKFLENTINQLFDQSESFINELNQGSFISNTSFIKKITVAIVRHQLKVVHSLRVLDRPAEYASRLELRQLYDTAAGQYELSKRFSIIQKKFNDLNEIIAPYQALSYSEKERRLLILEIFLLAIFPLPYLLKFIIPKILTFLSNM